MAITAQNINKKPGYKQTAIGMIPEDWEVKELGDVLTLQRGFDLPYKKRQSGKIPVVSSSGISGKHFRAKVPGPGIVTGRYGTIGQVFFINEDFWPLNTTLFVKEFKGNDPLFLSFLLSTIDFQTYSDKSGVPGVNRNDLHQIVVVLPYLPEQQAIATALNDMDALIASLDQLISKKKAIKQGTMQQLLTGKKRLPGFSGKWSNKYLEDISFMKGRIGWQGLKQSEFTINDNEPYLITGMNFKDGKIRWDEVYHVSNERYEMAKDIQLKSKDILMTKDGTIGKLLYVDNIPFPGIATLNSHLLVFRPIRDNYDPKFLYFQLASKAFKDFIELSKSGSTFFGISQESVGRYPVFLPPTKLEQTAIATILSDMDAEIESLEQKRDKYTMLKQGMMQQLLTGRIRIYANN